MEAKDGPQGTLKLLLAKGACVAALTDNREPLELAALQGYEKVMAVLLDQKEFRIKSVDAFDIGSLAVSRRHEALLKLLLARKFVDVTGERG